MIVKFCKECKWSFPEPDFEWNLKCCNPVVNSSDSWALGSTKTPGSSCTSERDKVWYDFTFPKCGRSGKLWAPRSSEEKRSATANPVTLNDAIKDWTT